MELIYSASKHSRTWKDWGREEAPLCSLSLHNLVAFVSPVALESGRTTLGEEEAVGEPVVEGGIEVVHYVYVCDIDKPWELHLVTSLHDRPVGLQWHVNGFSLLLGTTEGNIQVWSMKDYLISEWSLTQTGCIKGEEIIAVAWFHLGSRLTFNVDKKDSLMYSERITRSAYRPTLCHIGGKPSDGWVTVTATGLVGVGLSGPSEAAMKVNLLGTTRCRFTLADISFDNNGEIVIIATDNNISTTISCFRIVVTQDMDSCIVQVKPMASLFPKCHQDSSLRDSKTARLTHIQFLNRETPEQLLVAGGNAVGLSHVELWRLTTELINIHSFYQANTNIDSTFFTHKWTHQATVTHNSLPISIAAPRFPIISSAQEASALLFQYIAISYRDGSLKLVNHHNFQPVATTNLDVGLAERDFGDKRMLVAPHLTHMCQTFTGCGLVGIDQFSCLYVMKVVNTRDTVTHVPTIFLCGMLEYVMTNGYDCWDIIAALRPGIMENMIQKLSDNFSKQPAITQELCYPRFMATRAALYRACIVGQQRASDCHAKILLHSIATLFRSMFRPKAAGPQEMSPSEKLTAICSKNVEVDIDKILKTLNLDKNEFVVELYTLQALQQLVQWVANLTLYLLLCLPLAQTYGNHNFPGSLLVRDASVLSSLREILVIIRIWGMINARCLPSFTTTVSNYDVLSNMFKLLTHVWMSVKDAAGIDFSDNFIDEACMLRGQVLGPTVDQGMFGTLNYGSSVLLQQQPIKYTFGKMPNHLSTSLLGQTQMELPDGVTVSQHGKDVVRQISLGTAGSGDPTMECSRCGCCSLLRSVSKLPAVRAWELRYAKSCPCGGHWKLQAKLS